MGKIRVALLHLLPIAGEVEYNQQLIERAVRRASEKKVDWIITPELVVSGLQFSQIIGTDWIDEQPNEWMMRFLSLVKSVRATVFLGCPEKGQDGKYYNSVFVINRTGELIGKQRKITSGIDDWSTSGECMEPIDVGALQVGVVICADSYTKGIADTLAAKGAKLLIAPSAWGRGLHGPAGEWEQRTIDTGLCMFVCNRTGEDETVSFWQAESKVIKNGKCLLTHSSDQSAILTFDWDLEKMALVSDGFDVEWIDGR